MGASPFGVGTAVVRRLRPPDTGETSAQGGRGRARPRQGTGPATVSVGSTVAKVPADCPFVCGTGLPSEPPEPVRTGSRELSVRELTGLPWMWSWQSPQTTRDLRRRLAMACAHRGRSWPSRSRSASLRT